jgi:hypothetical protein
MSGKLACVAVIVACSAVAARAQNTDSPVQRGSVQVGGTASLSHSRDIGNDFESTTLDVTPRVGYFVARGLAVGLNLQFRRAWFDDQATIRDQTFTGHGFGPGLTYFLPTRHRRVFPA